jgi:hypothetical protein
VRGGGLEPPWLLTASTSTQEGPSGPNVFAEKDRQETSANVSERQISAARSQNPLTDDEVTRALAAAQDAWVEDLDRVRLARALFVLLRRLQP